jgi:hypothetical protein
MSYPLQARGPVYSYFEDYCQPQGCVPELIGPKNQHRAISMSIIPIIDSLSNTPKVQQRARSLNETQVSYPCLVSYASPIDSWNHVLLSRILKIEGPQALPRLRSGLFSSILITLQFLFVPSDPDNCITIRTIAPALTADPQVGSASPQNTPLVPTCLQPGRTSMTASSPI